MLTPWFAVSIGIVVATALTLATPHPALTFPNTQGGRCAHSGCASAPPPSKARHAAIKQGARLPPQADASVRANVTVQYAQQPELQGRFMAVIVITSKHALSDWTLRFALPGAHVESIMWAKWQPEGSAGVLVNGSPPPWPRSTANVARIVIFGTGTPRWPAGCLFNSARCTFRPFPARPGQSSDQASGDRIGVYWGGDLRTTGWLSGN